MKHPVHKFLYKMKLLSDFSCGSMKRILLLIPALFLAIDSSAQCTADTSCTSAEVLCSSNNSPGCENEPYSQVITIATPATVTDTNGTVYPLQSIRVTSITGLPPGISYVCNPSNCIFNGNTKGCLLFGDTTETPGSYPLTVNTTITILILNFIPYSFSYTFNAGPIVVQAKDCDGVCGGTASVDTCGICSGGNTGILPNCDDGDPCTTDNCDGLGGCTHAGSCNDTISGAIRTETGANVTGVTVTLSGDDNQVAVTTSNGLYSFIVAQGGNYTVTPSKSNDVTTNNGVTTGDISLIRKQVLTGNFFTSPYKIIAADANNSGTITTGDISFTRRVVLNNTNTFPIATTPPPITYGRLWEFVNSDQTFSGPPYNPFPFTKTRTYTNISSSQTNQNFIGIKLGDVNNNWNPATP